MSITQRIADSYTAAMVRWADFVRRRAVAVLVAAVVLAGFSLHYFVTNLAINTDANSLISQDLPFKRLQREMNEAFPELGEGIVIVVDGRSAEAADEAASRLARRLTEGGGPIKRVSYLADDPFFRRNGLLYLDPDELQKLLDRLAEAQPLLGTIVQDFNLRGLFKAFEQAFDDLSEGKAPPQQMAPALSKFAHAFEHQSDAHPEPVSWQELIRGEDATPSDRRRLIVVEPALNYATLQPAAAALRTIRGTIQELGLNAPENGAQVRLTGVRAMAADELRTVSQQVGLASFSAFTLVAFLVFFGVRNWRLIIAILSSLLLGLLYTASFGLFLTGRLNLVSVAFAVLFIGLGDDFCNHLALRYKEEVDKGKDHATALREAVAGTASPVMLSAICAAIGFFSFVPTIYLGLAELGLISGFGMFIATLTSFTITPAVLSLLPPHAPRAPAAAPAASAARTSNGARALRAARLTAGLAVLVAIAAAYVSKDVRFDSNPVNLRDPDTESVRAFIDLTRDRNTNPYRISIVAPDVTAAAAMADHLKALPTVDRTVTIARFVPSDQDEKRELIGQAAVFMLPVLMSDYERAPIDDAERQQALASMRDKLAALQLPGSDEFSVNARRFLAAIDGFRNGANGNGANAADGALARLEDTLLATLPGRLARLKEGMDPQPVALADVPESLRERYLAPDGRARVEVYPAVDVTDHTQLRMFVDQVVALAPRATDTPVVLLGTADAIVNLFVEAGLGSLLAIALLLYLVMRSATAALLMLLPLVLASLLTSASSVLLGLPFNFANIIVLPLLLGLGVAYGIHLVMRERFETDAEVDVTSTSTPRAVIFSSLTTIISFGQLAMSTHLGMRSMGILLTLALIYTLISTLVILPALLRLFPKAPAGAARA